MGHTGSHGVPWVTRSPMESLTLPLGLPRSRATGPRWRLPAVCTARLPALLAPHLRDAAPGAARADGRLRAPRQRARRRAPPCISDPT
eukprot:5113470-Prymnesium_polylepis.2